MKRYIGPREMLAMDPGAIRRDADGLYWLIGPDIPASCRHRVYGDVAIVHVRGSLEHHLTPGCDSYEGILEKLEKAKLGLDGEESMDPPSAIIQCIDSRGGVVAGLNQSVEAMQRMFPKGGVPLISYINEMAASAAYAWACGGHEIIGPASSITGSIGTISTMFSTVKQDQMMGVEVELITSGARKADGHPHAPITDAAKAAERDRVEKLAASFYSLASSARALPVKRLQSMQAAIYLGPDAKKMGLIDAVRSLDEVARVLSKTGPGPARTVAAKGNDTDRRMRA